ncbi:MAG TPA: zf-HC2 domain-containing protein [Stellaceae bacterium]|jgi:anti-sigma factor RsiW|nr:zf-HC2 domain-containing protein [Stellaceae bacterium]
MKSSACDEMHLLIQADIDGELRPAEAAGVAAHVEQCADCRKVQDELLALSQRIRMEATRHRAPDSLHAMLRDMASRAPSDAMPKAPAQIVTMPQRRRIPAASFGLGFALAACLAWFLVLPQPRDAGLPESIVSAHVHALQPGHLMDVVSTDQHTVKPWFDGKLPFAPPVKDLASQGFPLAGGRLDYVQGHTAAAMVYRHGLHVVELFAWPEPGASTAPSAGSQDGYNYLRWRQDGMSFWAVSDVSPPDLASFVADWRGT